MKDLLPCPSCGGAACIRNFCVSCLKCGMSGPIKVKQYEAIDAWNSLPRAPKWTVYDGTPQTLPRMPHNGNLLLLLDLPALGMKSSGWWRGYAWGIDRTKSLCEPMPGDRWMPWPGGE